MRIILDHAQARTALDHAHALVAETYPLLKDAKLLYAAAQHVKAALFMIITDLTENPTPEALEDLAAEHEQLSEAIAGYKLLEELEAVYTNRAVEFYRGDALYFADESMQVMSLSLDTVQHLLDTAKIAYGHRFEME